MARSPRRDEPPAKEKADDDRRWRLAEALRANLKKRRLQARAREEPAAGRPPGEEPPDDRD